MPAPELKPGTRVRSGTSDAEVVVVRAPSGPLELTCGGAPVVALDAPVESVPGVEGSTLLGKRYVDEQSGLELLCTKGGAGVLAADGRELALKAAKTLPSSD